MSDSLNNCCVIDALCGIGTASPQISRFTDGFDSIKFLLGNNFDEYTMMIITDIDGHVEIVNTDGINLTKETDEESGETFLMWKPERNITAESGVVIYQIAGFKSGSDNIESVWYSKEGRLMVTDSIDTTSYSASVMGAYPNLLTKLLIQSDETKNMAEVLKIFKKGNCEGGAVFNNGYSGLKAFYIKSIDCENKKIYLCNEKTVPEFSVVDNTNTSFDTPEFEIGDEFDIIAKTSETQRMHYSFIAKITSIANNVITYDADLPFNEIYDDAVDFSPVLFVSSKPDSGTVDIGGFSFAEGEECIAAGKWSHAEGCGSIASGRFSHAEGRETKAAYGAHSEGYQTIAKGNNSHSEGNKTLASGQHSHAEGSYSKATADISHAEGQSTLASGLNSHAEGQMSQATAKCAHAEGYNTRATAVNSHAEGGATQATNGFAHAEGNACVASGDTSHAEGSKTTASGPVAHSEGWGTIAAGKYQHVQGMYNIKDSSHKYAHIVGNGTASEASNAHTLDWSGNAWFAGTVETTGVILTSPGGIRYKLVVADDGTLGTEAV